MHNASPRGTDSATRLARLVAFYLPQFHPIPENDEWWGTGFTEWTNTAKARPMFRGHRQPRIPADLGFYDLRLPESREAQAALARRYGVEAFCYYHYWFAGRRLLERPFQEVLKSGSPSLPFCLCWANETWTGRWHGLDSRVLIAQTYPGEADHVAHFNALLPAFRDSRYMKVDGHPVFVIYRIAGIPAVRSFMELWNRLARDAGLPDIWFIAYAWPSAVKEAGAGLVRGITQPRFPAVRERASLRHPIDWVRWKLWQWSGRPTIYAHEKIADSMIPCIDVEGLESYPCIVPNWDNTPRSGRRGLVLEGSSPSLFKRQLDRAIGMTASMPTDHRIVFIKSWNEWAEGNYLEPDLKDGHAWLEVVDQCSRPTDNAQGVG